jgi:hypothetical protein
MVEVQSYSWVRKLKCSPFSLACRRDTRVSHPDEKTLFQAGSVNNKNTQMGVRFARLSHAAPRVFRGVQRVGESKPVDTASVCNSILHCLLKVSLTERKCVSFLMTRCPFGARIRSTSIPRVGLNNQSYDPRYLPQITVLRVELCTNLPHPLCPLPSLATTRI